MLDSPPEPSPEQELALLLSGTHQSREADRERCRFLIRVSDPDRLAQTLYEHALFALVGKRLLELAPDLLNSSFASRVTAAVDQGRRRALVNEQVTARLVSRLERAGVPTLPLKGATLAESIYGDPGLRRSNDIDVLVRRQDLARAVAELERNGYELVEGSLESDRLPPLHYGLAHADRWLPPVELHWRVHWYEQQFSSGVLEHSSVDSGGVRRPKAADELAMLLLFFARDGFIGLRYAADIAAWWDTRGQALEPRALDPIGDRHPELRRVLTVASAQAERLVGVPAHRLISLPPEPDRRNRLALGLVNWSLRGDRDQMAANRVLLDWLLLPEGGQREFVRRFLVPSAGSVVRYEHMPVSRRPPWLVWRLTHGPKVVARSLYALWSLKGSHDWAPVPTRPRPPNLPTASAETGRTPARRATRA